MNTFMTLYTLCIAILSVVTVYKTPYGVEGGQKWLVSVMVLSLVASAIYLYFGEIGHSQIYAGITLLWGVCFYIDLYAIRLKGRIATIKRLKDWQDKVNKED